MSCDTCNNNCCLIDFKCIIDNTPLNSFSDESDIMNSLLLAQVDIVNDFIGQECYEELCASINAATDIDPLSGNMLELKKAIEKPLSWKTFYEWLKWYSNVTYGDSATTKATDRSGNSFSNISPEEKKTLMSQAYSRYTSFKNDTKKLIDALNLDCLKKDCSCSIEQEEIKQIKDDYTSHLPDVV